MDDDLEYFISFPTPKPYIENLKKKFNSKTKGYESLSSELKISRPSDCGRDVSSSQVTEYVGETVSPEDVSIQDKPQDQSCDSESETDLEDDFSPGHKLPYFGSSNGKEPVVLLLGWMGANDNHLAKYAALYTARGCICVRYTAPPAYHYMFKPSEYMAPLAEKLVGVLREMHLHLHPLVCHAFSNHGATLYYYVSKALDEDHKKAIEDSDLPITMRGCIFDSCPAPRKVWSGTLAVYNIIEGPALAKLLSAVGAWLYLVGWSLVSVLQTLVTGRLSARLPWTLVQECRRVPQLFLYSTADALISAGDVENFMAERKKLGVPVVAKKWPDSPHVQHYRWYPEEYSRLVFSFLSRCLGEGTRPASLPLPANNSQPQQRY